MINPEARKRLADLMDQRRVDLRLTWREVAEAGGISYEALRAARSGPGDIRLLTQAAIEDGLHWERGSIARTLAGGEPVPVSPGGVSRSDVDFQAGIPEEELRPYVDGVLQQAYEALAGLFSGELSGPGDPNVEKVMLTLPGKAVFPENEDEQHVWDNPVYSPRERVDLIARFRWLAAQMAKEQRRRTGTGLIGHVPATGAVTALIPVGRRALRASS